MHKLWSTGLGLKMNGFHFRQKANLLLIRIPRKYLNHFATLVTKIFLLKFSYALILKHCQTKLYTGSPFSHLESVLYYNLVY